MPQPAVPTTPTLAERHAAFVTGLAYADLPPRAISAAKQLVIDAVACGHAAADTAIGDALERWSASAAPGDAVAFGISRTMDAESSALANGALIHALDFDDIPHFAAVELPPAMAIAAEREVSGEELLVALVAGFEVAARITSTLAHGRPAHPIGVVGPIGAAVVAARLLGLDTRQTATAICIAASTGAGLTQNFGTFTKPFHTGRAAQAGLQAARLAAAGWTADLAALEGPKGFYVSFCDPAAEPEVDYSGDDAFWIARAPEDLAAGSPFDPAAWPPVHTGGSLDVSRVGRGAPSDLRRGGPNLRRGPSFKPWPACGGNNATLTAVFSLVDGGGIDRAEIESAEIVVPSDPKNGALFRNDDPADGFQGKFSLRYGVAAAILDGRVDTDSYDDDTYRRMHDVSLFDRVTLRIDPDFVENADPRPDDPECNWAAVTLHLSGGRSVTGWAFNRGLELAEDAVGAKFDRYATPRLGDEASREVLARLTALEAESDVRDLVARMTNAAR